MPDDRRQLILDTFGDAVSSLLYYNRKDDEELPRGEIQKAIAAGEVTIDELCTIIYVDLHSACKIPVPKPSATPSVVRCAFCGEPYPTGTPTSQHESLTAHIKVCTAHPMREAEKRIQDLRALLYLISQRCAIPDVLKVIVMPELARDPMFPNLSDGRPANAKS